jgi:hypothetical protein
MESKHLPLEGCETFFLSWSRGAGVDSWPGSVEFQTSLDAPGIPSSEAISARFREFINCSFSFRTATQDFYVGFFTKLRSLDMVEMVPFCLRVKIFEFVLLKVPRAMILCYHSEIFINQNGYKILSNFRI